MAPLTPRQNYKSKHLLTFDLSDHEEQEPVLFIDDSASGHDVKFTVKNEGKVGQTITLPALTNTEKPSDAYHFALKFRPGTINPNAYDLIALMDSGWDFEHVTELDGTDVLYMRSATTRTIAASDSLALTLQHMRADGRGGARGSRVEFLCNVELGAVALQNYYLQQHLEILNHRGRKKLPLHVGFVGNNKVLNDGSTANTLTLRLTNTLRPNPAFPERSTLSLDSGDSDAPTRFILAFDAQEASYVKEWALGTVDQVGAIGVNLGTKKKVIGTVQKITYYDSTPPALILHAWKPLPIVPGEKLRIVATDSSSVEVIPGAFDPVKLAFVIVPAHDGNFTSGEQNIINKGSNRKTRSKIFFAGDPSHAIGTIKSTGESFEYTIELAEPPSKPILPHSVLKCSNLDGADEYFFMLNTASISSSSFRAISSSDFSFKTASAEGATLEYLIGDTKRWLNQPSAGYLGDLAKIAREPDGDGSKLTLKTALKSAVASHISAGDVLDIVVSEEGTVGATVKTPPSGTNIIIHEDLTDLENDIGKGISVFLNDTGWSGIRQHTQGLQPEWEIAGGTGSSLKAGESFELEISNIVTDIPSGFANVYLRHENIPGYWDGEQICQIERTPIIIKDEAGPTDRVGIGTTAPLAKLHVEGGRALVNAADNLYTPATTAHPTPAASPGRLYDRTGEVMPVGAIMPYAGVVAPPGWLLCKGELVKRSDYQDLFKVLSTTYGAGDGKTTFGVPDLRSRVPIGVGTGAGLSAYALAAKGGNETHGLSVDELAAHGHLLATNDYTFLESDTSKLAGDATGAKGEIVFPDSGPHTHKLSLDTQNDDEDGNGNYALEIESDQELETSRSYGSVGTDQSEHHHRFHGLTQNTGQGTLFKILQPWLALNFIIKC